MQSCRISVQNVKNLMDQALWRNTSDLLTKLSTELGHNLRPLCGSPGERKLRKGKYSLLNQVLAAFGLALHTILSTEDVQKFFE
jgi:hypothetical protein